MQKTYLQDPTLIPEKNSQQTRNAREASLPMRSHQPAQHIRRGGPGSNANPVIKAVQVARASVARQQAKTVQADSI